MPVSERDDKQDRKLTRRGFLKWTTALAVVGAAAVGVGAGYGADLLLRPSTEKTSTTTKTATSTITKPGQTVTETAIQTQTQTTTKTVAPPVETLSYKPPLSPEVQARVNQIIQQQTAMHQDESVAYSIGCGTNCGAGGGWDTGCLFKVHVKNGVITAIEPDDTVNPNVAREDNNPDSVSKVLLQRRPCVRGRAWKGDLYSPSRVTYPMRQISPRGQGKFVRITWDDALATVANMITTTVNKYGPNSIFSVYDSVPGPLSYVNAGFGGWATASFEATSFAASFMTGGYSWASGYGSAEAPDIFNSKLIVLQGIDPTSSQFMLFTQYYYALAKEKGIPIIVIDPRYTATAEAFGSQWIPIRPGTDIVFQLAVANVLFKENLYNQDFVSKFVEPTGFAKWKDYVLGNTAGPDGAKDRTPAWAEKICGIPAETITAFARLYAKSSPTYWNVSWAFARLVYGENPARAAAYLQAMTGNIGVPGGGGEYGQGFVARGAFRGISTDWGRGRSTYRSPTLFRNWKWADMVLLRPQVDQGTLTAAQYNALIGNPATNPLPNPRMLFATKNFMNQDININKQHAAFKQLDYVVQRTIHSTPTTMFADIVLPMANSVFEDYILTGGPSYGPRIITPPGEAKPNLWIDTQLANKLGVLAQYMPKYTTDDQWDSMVQSVYQKGYETWAASAKETTTWQQFQQTGLLRQPAVPPYNVPLQDNIQSGKAFSTASGKIEFFSDYLATTDLTKTKYGAPIAPMAEWQVAWDDPYDPAVATYPITLMTPHGQYRIHSVQDDNPALKDETYRHSIWLSVADAKSRGIHDGDTVHVFNDVGEMVLPAYVTSKIVPGTACIYQGAWSTPTGSGTDLRGASNTLTHDGVNPAGAWPFHANVQVEKY